jgi:hypothetical protein
MLELAQKGADKVAPSCAQVVAAAVTDTQNRWLIGIVLVISGVYIISNVLANRRRDKEFLKSRMAKA